MTDIDTLRAVNVVTELTYELECAHKIITNALNLMTNSQKQEWASMNAGHCVDGEGITRAHEREKAIKLADASGFIREAEAKQCRAAISQAEQQQPARCTSPSGDGTPFRL